MSKLLAGGFLGVLMAEAVGVVLGWRWALPIAGAALALFGVALTRELAAKPSGAGAPAGDDATEALRRWKSQTEDLIRWADGTRADWDRYLRPKLARDFLLATNQREPAAVAATGRMLFGDDLWQWVDPRNVAPPGAPPGVVPPGAPPGDAPPGAPPPRRDDPAPGREALDQILRRLEQA